MIFDPKTYARKKRFKEIGLHTETSVICGATQDDIDEYLDITSENLIVINSYNINFRHVSAKNDIVVYNSHNINFENTSCKGEMLLMASQVLFDKQLHVGKSLWINCSEEIRLADKTQADGIFAHGYSTGRSATFYDEPASPYIILPKDTLQIRHFEDTVDYIGECKHVISETSQFNKNIELLSQIGIFQTNALEFRCNLPDEFPSGLKMLENGVIKVDNGQFWQHSKVTMHGLEQFREFFSDYTQRRAEWLADDCLPF